MKNQDTGRFRRLLSRDGRWALVLGVLMFVVYFASPVLYIHDSNYSMLTGESLLIRGDLQLDSYFWPTVDSTEYPEVRPGHQLPRQVRPAEGHLYYWYPLGPSVLSTPLIAGMKLVLRESTIGPDGRFDPVVEARWQKRIAAALTALICVVLFYAARLQLPLFHALLIAISAGFSSQLWSTASRAVRTHTWAVLLLSIAVSILLRAEAPGKRPHPLVLALLFSFAFYSRPTTACIILPLAFYFVWRHRRQSVTFALYGVAGVALFLWFNQLHFASWMPPYFALGGGIGPSHLATGLAGQLVSPSRGLLVYCPLVLVVAWLVSRYASSLPHRGLAAASVASVVFLAIVLGMFRNWWGGSCYGARFYTDAIPIFALLAILGVAGALRSASESADRVRRRGFEVAFFATCFLFGAVVNGAGAISNAGKRWNAVPRSITADPSRAFDWKRAQFICALFPERLEPEEPVRPGSRR